MKIQDDAKACRLCREEGKPLKRSHLIPHAAYKLARNNRPQKLVMLTAKRVITTDTELVANMLCGDCEQRLNKNGEKWVFQNLRVEEQDFPLRKMITSTDSSLLGTHRDWAVYDCQKIPDLQRDKLAYFALSIFWRAGQTGWPLAYKGIELGPYSELLREYLLNPGELLDERIFLMIQVHAKEKVIHKPLIFPFTKRLSGARLHEFRVPGLTCRLLIGERATSNKFQSGCLLKNKTITVAPDSASFIAQMAELKKTATVAENLKHSGT